MTITAEAKIVQYLGEARAREEAWRHTLAGHIAMTPSGSYRDILERQRNEADRHAERVQQRLRDLGENRGWLGAVAGVVTRLLGHAVSVGKATLDLAWGGGSGEEKMLKNAEDEMASLQRAVVTYRALAHLARAVDDTATAELAGSVIGDKEKGLRHLEEALDGLVDAVVSAEFHGKVTYDPSTIAIVRTARRVADGARRTVEKMGAEFRSRAKQGLKVPEVPRIEGEIKGAVVDAADLRVANYDELTAEEIIGQLGHLSQVDLAKVDAYERKNKGRSTVTGHISALCGDEPWPGYDDQTVVEIRKLLSGADDALAQTVSDYEHRHKRRHGVLETTEPR